MQGMFDAMQTMLYMAIMLSAAIFWMAIAMFVYEAVWGEGIDAPEKKLKLELEETKNKLRLHDDVRQALTTLEEHRPAWMVVTADDYLGWRVRYGEGDLSTDADSLARGDVSASSVACGMTFILDWPRQIV